MREMNKTIIRKAILKDVRKIQELVNHYARMGLMLPRSLNQIIEDIRDFTVAEINNNIVGCVALHLFWENLAEIRSLAVKEGRQRQRIGTNLIQNALNEASELGVERVFVLTYRPELFSKIGFKLIQKQELPHKIWKDCLDCIKFPDCDEISMMVDLKVD